MKTHRYAILVVLLVLPLAASSAQSTASGPTLKAVAAAKTFLGMLDVRQRARVSIDLNVTTRSRWSNLPNGATGLGFERNGIKLGDMTAAQQDAALALVAATLSPTGYQKVMNIVNADENLERSSAPARDAANRVRFGRGEYQIAILGAPSATQPWMIQFGGHHLAINITVVGAENVLTPSHTGAQPVRYSLNGQIIRPLGNENDKAFALINALNDAQRKQAILQYRVADTVLGPGHDGEVIQPEGARASTFNANQQGMLLGLVNEWVSIINDTAAATRMGEIKARLADTYFAWSGPTTNGSPAYFRIQGPTVMIEYAPQGGSTDHIHTFYRDPTNDYGAKVIRP